MKWKRILPFDPLDNWLLGEKRNECDCTAKYLCISPEVWEDTKKKKKKAYGRIVQIHETASLLLCFVSKSEKKVSLDRFAVSRCALGMDWHVQKWGGTGKGRKEEKELCRNYLCIRTEPIRC